MADLYQFTFRAVERRDDPYYHTNWDGSRLYEVVAENRAEGFEKLGALLGKSDYQHYHWTAKCLGAKDMRIVEAELRSKET